MLSYQHAYHAGNLADVAKHTLWALLLQHATQKPTPLYVYETHAARGLYPVNTPEMQKITEYQSGLAQLFPKYQTEPNFNSNPYLATVQHLNPTGQLAFIPGSPVIAAHLLREADHLHLAEKHPQEFAHLKQSLHRPNLHLHAADGPTTIPKHIRQGQRTLALIDPSYELKTEYESTAQAAAAIFHANRHAVVMIWYPLLVNQNRLILTRALKSLNVQATWLAEWRWQKPKQQGMHGSGQVILNLPYQLENTLTQALQTLTQQLKIKEPHNLTTKFLTPRR
ncbi:MAG: 23S rRNA (adenine(2030)-N(6))-methyltransferase RlmJ [Proteobacteria bacterium]|nr:23S rRNA (adenine(2030)-N(6))-methyltransferase RlmJ [Pseudomonadota bacterium]NBX86011.1 23S rRNA (adenine(2030)-N(6))-methyltransferase RlmJ [Pseudomonadota bacterium]